MKNKRPTHGGCLCMIAAGFVLLAGAVDRASAADKQRGYFLATKAFRAAVEKVLPSVVMIESYGGVTQRNATGQRRSSQGISRAGDGPTTGLIVSPDGYIVTSTFNFIKKPPIITVVLRDGTQHVAKLLGRDETRKMCILKIDGVSDLPVARYVPRSELKVGQWAVSVGVGYGDADPAISAGIVSATSRISGKAVQTDANISPANYGGPLVDIEGRVIGICMPLSPQSKDVSSGVAWYDSGIGFAVPLHGADTILAQLKQGKVVHPGRMGVQPAPATAKGEGVKVAAVSNNSPAEKAGVKKDDLILAVAGEKILDVTHLRAVMGRFVAGEKVKLRIKRGDEEQDVEMTLAEGVEPVTPAKKPRIDIDPNAPQPKPNKDAPKKDEAPKKDDTPKDQDDESPDKDPSDPDAIPS